MSDVKPVKKRGRPKIDPHAILASGKSLADMTPSEIGAVVKVLFEFWHASQRAASKNPAPAPIPQETPKRALMRVERERKQAIFDKLYDRRFKIAEAAAEAGTDYATAQRARMIWEGKKSLEDRQKALMSPSARRAAEISERDTVGSASAKGSTVAPEPVAINFNFDPADIPDIVARLNATLGDTAVAPVMPDETDD